MGNPADRREWLETDGLGGFATGPVHGPRTRRYHGLLVAAATPPTGRMMMMNGVEVRVRTSSAELALTPQRYAPGVDHPGATAILESFTSEPWPAWVYRAPGHLRLPVRIRQELLMLHGSPATLLTWQLEGPGAARLVVRPFVSGRDYHALHRENPALRFEPARGVGRWTWQLYDGVPPLTIRSRGRYRHDPLWFRNALYEEERARGFDAVEDVASPGELEFDLEAGQSASLLAIASAAAPDAPITALRERERERRAAFSSPLHRAADAYLVRRGEGLTIVAGYPWFTDWGRDTFIAIRGLCLATGRLDDARRILTAWADTISEGMVPNRFPDAGGEPEYNAVDASLWFVVACGELMAARPAVTRTLKPACLAILEGYWKGTRYGIRADGDGLLAAGEPGQQLTWMDARVDGREVTPRIGKPVEVQALWFNALMIAAQLDAAWSERARRARESFLARFWNHELECLFDVVDVEHRPGAGDPTVRPNQVFAVGGLPHALLDGPRARRVVDVVERRLLTPWGLRSLDPGHPDYRLRYEGGPAARDGAYHQGTVWPWLLGPFIDAWLRTRGSTDQAKLVATTRFVKPLREHLHKLGVGHLPEIVDAVPPHAPRGCPFQAWSLGELIRARALTRVESAPGRRKRVTA